MSDPINGFETKANQETKTVIAKARSAYTWILDEIHGHAIIAHVVFRASAWMMATLVLYKMYKG
jgi:hypothetical protein